MIRKFSQHYLLIPRLHQKYLQSRVIYHGCTIDIEKFVPTIQLCLQLNVDVDLS
jgi:hypothetical protein